MTIIRILLIGGLVYIALQQKKISIRNTILVITVFLALCMSGKEGLQISVPETPESCTGTPTDSSQTCAIDETATGDARCPDGCTYVAGVPSSSRDFAAGDLEQLIPSCTPGTLVNETGTACITAPTSLPENCRAGKVLNDDLSGCEEAPTCPPACEHDDVDCSSNSYYDEYDSENKTCK